MASSAAIITPPAPPPLVAVPDLGADLSGYIGKYLKLREMKKAMEDRHKAEKAPVVQMLEMFENGFLAHLQKSNSDSASVKDIGTVYKTTKSSATIADGAEFRRFVIGGEQWGLVDWRANAPAVEAFINENAHLPPGVNFTQRVEVNVRKA